MPPLIVSYPLPSINWVLAASASTGGTDPRPVRPISQRARLQLALKKRIARPVLVEEHMSTVDYRYEAPPRPPSPPPERELLSIPVIVIEDCDAIKQSSEGDISSRAGTVVQREVRRRRSKTFAKGICSFVVALRCTFHDAKTTEQVEKDLRFDLLN